MQGQPRGLRGLKILVGVLGVLVVLGTTLVIGIIIHRIYAAPATASMAAAAPQGIPPVTDPLILPAGTRIIGVAGAGGAIAVATTGPGGDQLWLVNLQTGARFVTMSAAK